MPITEFSKEYRDNVFTTWYNRGKPNVAHLAIALQPDPSNDNIPTRSTLKMWIDTEFRQRADVMDTTVSEELEKRLVQDKIAMLQKHAGLGVKMQDMAMAYLDEHQKDLTSSSAVRLLVEGVRIERGSRGIPEALEDMMKKDDDELLLEIENILANAPLVSEEPNE